MRQLARYFSCNILAPALALCAVACAGSPGWAQYSQFGSKTVILNIINQGNDVAVSADGTTMIVGGVDEAHGTSGPFVMTRTGSGPWTTQARLNPTDVTYQTPGTSVALSADGNTAAVGGPRENSDKGAVWIFTRDDDGAWTQQGPKLLGSNPVGAKSWMGLVLVLSGDGDTLLAGGPFDNSEKGAAWIFKRAGGVWTEQSGKLVPADLTAAAFFGVGVALSFDGATAAIGGGNNNFNEGGVWVYTRSGSAWTQQGSKLLGTGSFGSVSRQGFRTALSYDGNTLLFGGMDDGYPVGKFGAAWVFARAGGVWTQQGAKLVGTGASGEARQGSRVALSADGNIAAVSGTDDNSDRGAVWVFHRSGTTWSQFGQKLTGNDSFGPATLGQSLGISADGNTIVAGGPLDFSERGAVWTFVQADFLTSPATNIAATGHAGGPFLAPSFDFTLSAINADTGYTVAGVPNWLTATSTAGTAGANTPKSLSFTVNANAANLPAGTYGPTNITITNTTNGKGNRSISATLTVGNQSGASVVSAVLPASRSVPVGTAATAFATIINTSGVTGANCGLGFGSADAAGFAFQTTDPATNAVTGTLNTGVTIPANGVQSFVFAITPEAALNPTDIPILAGCANSAPATSVVGLNTLLLSASSTPIPDIVALAATAGNDGIVNVAGANGQGAFAVATVNVGITATITASADTGSATLPVGINLCQTNPATGQCTSVTGPTVTTPVLANATPTFAIFLQGSGNVPFDPAHNRIFVRFKDSGGVVRGATSVAVRTQ